MKKSVAVAVSIAIFSFAPALLANDAHHPDQGAGAAAVPTTPKVTTKEADKPVPRPAAAARSDKMGEQMKKMQDMHEKMMAAKTPEERQKLMDEHMQLMQDGMGMMKDMGGMGCAMMGKKDKAPLMSDRHDMMEKRMEMMEMMMQMMMDRQGAGMPMQK